MRLIMKDLSNMHLTKIQIRSGTAVIIRCLRYRQTIRQKITIDMGKSYTINQFSYLQPLLEEIMEKYRNTICMSNRIRQMNGRKLYRMEHLLKIGTSKSDI